MENIGFGKNLCNSLSYVTRLECVFDEVFVLKPDLSTWSLGYVCSTANSSLVKHICRVKLLGAEDLISPLYGDCQVLLERFLICSVIRMPVTSWNDLSMLLQWIFWLSFILKESSSYQTYSGIWMRMVRSDNGEIHFRSACLI